MAVDIFIALRLLLARDDLDEVFYVWDRKERRHVITAVRRTRQVSTEYPVKQQTIQITDEFLAHVQPEVGVRLLERKARELLALEDDHAQRSE